MRPRRGILIFASRGPIIFYNNMGRIGFDGGLRLKLRPHIEVPLQKTDGLNTMQYARPSRING